MSSPSPFGQNEWLVEEMYRKFREDPSSVDPSWHEFLVDYSPEPTNEVAPRGNGKPAAAPTSPPEPAPAPPPKAASSNGAAKQKDAESATPAAKSASSEKAEPKRAEPKKPEKAEPKQDEPTKPEAKKPDAPAPSKPAPAAEGDENQVLRGAAAAVVKNMSASLDVPTATSVRAIPAKAMIDNRIVINNHLKRTRGGKISFTHLLGYAIVQAVKKFPNMNRHFAEVDGKPNTVTPAHTNLGLAIDLPGKDGKRSLVVAAIKNCENMSFGRFIAAYEDIVRRARDGLSDVALATPGGSAPLSMGTNVRCLLSPTSSNAITEVDCNEVALDVGMQRKQTPTTTERLHRFDGLSSYHYDPSKSHMTLKVVGYTDDFYAGLAAGTTWRITLYQPGDGTGAGKGWCIHAGKARLVETPARTDIDMVHGTSLKFQLVEPADATVASNEDLEKSRFVIALA